MFEKAYELAIVISAIDQVTGPARAMAAQFELLGKQSDAVQQKIKGFKAMALTGGAITLVGAGLAKGIFDAVDAAGNLQTSMMAVKESMGLTNAELKKMTDLSMTVGIPTIFSSEQVGGIMQAMSTAGLSKQQVMDPEIIKQYVNFADVQAQIKHEEGADVVSTAVTMAHQFQLYSTEQIKPFLNNLNAALEHTHDSAQEFATTYKYISNQARSQGMNANDTLATTAWLGRMGFGSGKGGTNFADFMQRSIYHSSGAKADGAMEEAGFVKDGRSVFSDKGGNFVGIPESVKIMQDFAKRFNNNANLMDPLLHEIFGTQGARVAQMMTSQGASEQYTNVQKQITGSTSTDQTQEDLNNTWQGKIKQFQTTLKDIQQAFGQNVMPKLMPVLSFFDKLLEKALIFEQRHPRMVAWIATFLSIAAAAGLVIGPLMILVGAIGYLSTSGIIGAGFQILGKSLLGMLGPVSLIVGAVFLLYEAWTHNWGGIREKTAAAVKWIRAELPIFIGEMKDLFTKAKVISEEVWTAVKSAVVIAWNAIKNTVGPVVASVWGTIRSAFTQVKDFINAVWPDIKKVISMYWPMYRDIIVTYMRMIWDVIKFAARAVWDTINFVWTGLWATIKFVWTMIKDDTQLIWDLISGVIKIGLKLLQGDWSGAWELIKTTAGKVWDDIKKIVSDAWTGIQTLADTWYTDALGFGKNIVKGIIDGIKNLGGDLIKGAVGLWHDFEGAFMKAGDMHSPSRIMMAHGGFIAQGLALGILDNANLVKNAASHLSALTSDGQSDSFLANTMNSVGKGDTNVTIGDIHIHGASERQSGDIVDELMRRLGTKARMGNMSLPFGPNRLVQN